ncbi:hypothetical protein [Saccharicrinis sp. FJH54]|uniref:DUF7935 family protein n=1 Tax=Saccharicrinis sp. FJH54 TaxID=3344665 RepID=UPI0035D3DD39
MNELWEVIKFIIPALLVWWAVYVTQNRFFKQSEKNRYFELKNNNQKVTTPLKFRAYERMILFLERITPENLVLRVQRYDMNSMQLHSELLKTIRMEYEHNLSQQLYVSPEAWVLIITAKESVVKLLNSTVSGINPQAPSIELSKEFIEEYHNAGKTPVDLAKQQLQKEVSQYF